jgi:hypothetical protein
MDSRSISLFLALTLLSSYASAQLQTVSASLSLEYLYTGKTTNLTVSYRATDDALLTGLHLRLHFDSSVLQIGDVENLLLESAQGSEVQDDISDFDSDTSTDKYFIARWADITGDGWPVDLNTGAPLDQPVTLYTVPFTAISGFNDTILRFTGASTAAGYTLESDDIDILLDIVPPSISLIGSDIISVVGASYVDAGATALDNVDGDISDNIVATTYVNTNSAGSYSVKYNVSDGNGNAATEVVRNVTVTDADSDGDGILDGYDNCVNEPNFDQTDTDTDEIGDACDPDDDNDGVPDVDDTSPLDPTNDSDGDGVANNIDTLPLDYSNHGVFSYAIENGAVTITGCVKKRPNGYEDICPNEITIPAMIDGLPVTKIGIGAFKNKSNITEAIIPEGIIEIGNEAFWQTGLNEIIIPDSVVTIGDSSFIGIYAASLKIGSGTKTIGSSAFRGNSITSLVIPNSVITIGQSAFEYNDLIDVTLPSNLETIPPNLFSDNNLQIIRIPDSVTVIGEYAFTKNPLKNITFSEYIVEIGYQPIDSIYIEYVQFLGHRPSISSETLTKNIVPYVTYCPDKIGWAGVEISGATPVLDCDSDGVLDLNDNYPLISVRGYTDSDADGSPDECDTSCEATGMIADNDDDNDGLDDQFDDLPLDPNEQIDTDGDGIGNNADIDDDGDGVIDTDDLYPLDSTKQSQKLLDIDGNDKVDALTDGLVILRYVFGLRGDVLIGGVVASDATRKTAEEIEAYLASLMPSL